MARRTWTPAREHPFDLFNPKNPKQPAVSVLFRPIWKPIGSDPIAKHIEQTTSDVLRVDHGSLYPALHRLVRNGWIAAKWEKPRDRNREFKFYRLTTAGRKQLRVEESKWEKLARAIGQVMKPMEET